MTKSGYDLLLQKAQRGAKIPIPDAGISPPRDMWKPGTGYLESALRELKEELGIDALGRSSSERLEQGGADLKVSFTDGLFGTMS